MQKYPDMFYPNEQISAWKGTEPHTKISILE